MNKVKVTFTAVFRIASDTSFGIGNSDKLIYTDDTKYEDASIKFAVHNDRKMKLVTFEATGYRSDCRIALEDFLVNLLRNIKTGMSYQYLDVQKVFQPFIEVASKQFTYQSMHRFSTDDMMGGIEIEAGLEIERENDMRTNDAHRVLIPNDHYGNMFRQCPNCKEFEIMESNKFAKKISRCPCCGLKLIPW